MQITQNMFRNALADVLRDTMPNWSRDEYAAADLLWPNRDKRIRPIGYALNSPFGISEYPTGYFALYSVSNIPNLESFVTKGLANDPMWVLPQFSSRVGKPEAKTLAGLLVKIYVDFNWPLPDRYVRPT